MHWNSSRLGGVLVQPEIERSRFSLVRVPPLGREFSKYRYDPQAIPQHGCVPAKPLSPSPGRIIVAPPRPSDSTSGLPGVWVVLVPDEAHRNEFHLFKLTTTDPYGRYDLRGIAPGDYKLFSWEPMDELYGWEDPDFLKPFESKGQNISLQEATVNLSNLWQSDRRVWSRKNSNRKTRVEKEEVNRITAAGARNERNRGAWSR
jgi:hypothetical protein